jgi:cytoskeletal protein CcmA (bactofilin family)
MGLFGSKPPETTPDEAAARKPAPATAPAPPGAARSACVIGSRTVVKGEISGEEDVIVEGVLEGQVRINRDLKVGAGGVVKATVIAQSVVVSGELTGDCSASGRVEIQATGRLTGNIRAPKVVIAEGAMFKGNSDMSGQPGHQKEERANKIAAS